MISTRGISVGGISVGGQVLFAYFWCLGDFAILISILQGKVNTFRIRSIIIISIGGISVGGHNFIGVKEKFSILIAISQ